MMMRLASLRWHQLIFLVLLLTSCGESDGSSGSVSERNNDSLFSASPAGVSTDIASLLPDTSPEPSNKTELHATVTIASDVPLTLSQSVTSIAFSTVVADSSGTLKSPPLADGTDALVIALLKDSPYLLAFTSEMVQLGPPPPLNSVVASSPNIAVTRLICTPIAEVIDGEGSPAQVWRLEASGTVTGSDLGNVNADETFLRNEVFSANMEWPEGSIPALQTSIEPNINIGGHIIEQDMNCGRWERFESNFEYCRHRGWTFTPNTTEWSTVETAPVKLPFSGRPLLHLTRFLNNYIHPDQEGLLEDIRAQCP